MLRRVDKRALSTSWALTLKYGICAGFKSIRGVYEGCLIGPSFNSHSGHFLLAYDAPLQHNIPPVLTDPVSGVLLGVEEVGPSFCREFTAGIIQFD